MRRVVAFSLWGKNPMYTVGAVRNAQLAREVYPDYTCRVYLDSTVPLDTVESLKLAGAELIFKPDNVDCSGMLWRCEALCDPTVDVALIRDADGRLTAREAVATNQWLASGKCYHVVRDHPHHHPHLMVGAFAGRGSQLPELQARLNARKRVGFWEDFNFMDGYWESSIKPDHLGHDEYTFHTGQEIRIPAPYATPWSFIGGKLNADDTPLYDLVAMCPTSVVAVFGPELNAFNVRDCAGRNRDVYLLVAPGDYSSALRQFGTLRHVHFISATPEESPPLLTRYSSQLLP